MKITKYADEVCNKWSRAGDQVFVFGFQLAILWLLWDKMHLHV